MRAHPEAAQAYDRLKQDLAHQHGDDVTHYYKGKTAFLEQISQKATTWKANISHRSQSTNDQ